MSEDVQTGSQLEDEDDDYTLFGSPPPSPGRSPSPTLALPGHGNGLNKRQNVGTIALPGSQPYSELPMNPLALSLSLPLASRPPAQGCSSPAAPQTNAPQHPPQGYPSPVTAQAPVPQHPPQKQTPSAPSTSASQAKPNGSSSNTQKRKKSKSKSKESTPRPEITLPDPSAPPPANFLRNQSALLGTAGLVGGIKPAKLATNRQIRGTTPSNPIVVDDEDEPPVIGKSRYRNGMNQIVDPSRLPAPSNQDIVSMLIGQKDIFPVLESILKLIANGATSTPQRTGFERRTPLEIEQQQAASDQPPPSKKRKLNRVPAGATDWDVPYPFPQGEGPEEYRRNWERERGKQLIAQLVNLIKVAARKAAMKNYAQKEANRKKYEEEAKRLRELEECRRREVLEARAKASSSGVLLDKANELSGSASNQILMGSGTESVCRTSPATSADPSGTATPYSGFSSPIQTSTYSQLPYLPSQQNQDINQLISSLLASAPDPSLDMSTSLTNGTNQDLLDNWMNALRSQQPQGQSSSACSSASTPDPDTFDFTGLDFTMEDNDFAIRDCDLDAIIAPSPQPNRSDQVPTSNSQSSHASPHDINCNIDPSLLDTVGNGGGSGVSMDGGMNQAPLLSPSPVPSTRSSVGHNGPATPNSTTWDAYRPNIFSPIDNFSTTQEIEPTLVGTCGADGILASNGGSVVNALDVKGKRKADDSSVPAMDIQMPTYLGHHAAATPTASDNSSTSTPISIPTVDSSNLHTKHLSSNSSSLSYLASSSTPSTSTLALPLSQISGPIGVRKSTKKDVLRRGRERKEQLEAELARIKTKLWETTIEQGALSHIVRHYNEVGSNNSSNTKS